MSKWELMHPINCKENEEKRKKIELLKKWRRVFQP
jgi:hypothetical protein